MPLIAKDWSRGSVRAIGLEEVAKYLAEPHFVDGGELETLRAHVEHLQAVVQAIISFCGESLALSVANDIAVTVEKVGDEQFIKLRDELR